MEIDAKFIDLGQLIGVDANPTAGGQEPQEPVVGQEPQEPTGQVTQEQTGGQEPQEPQEPHGGGDQESVGGQEPQESSGAQESSEQQELSEGVGQYVKKVFEKLVESGVLPKIEAFEDEEGNEIPIDEIDWDDETLVSVIQQYMEEQLAKAKESALSGVSDITKKLVEIDKNGGDITKVLQVYDSVIKPIDDMDISNPDTRKSLLYQYYKSKGLGKEEVEAVVGKLIAEGKDEEKALEVKGEIMDAFEKMLEAEKERVEQEKREREQKLKEYRKQLSQAIGEKVKLSDSKKRKLLEYIKYNDKGELEVVDIIRQQIQDPNVAADVLLFLFNRDEYIKNITEQKVNKEKIKVYKRLKLANKGGTVAPQNKPTGNNVNDDVYVDLNKII